jgi:TRAP-type C4-dicarboxylate transport system substrate-binding protein
LTVSMNLDAWNKLPKEVQAIFTELSGSYMAKLSGEVQDKAGEEAFAKIKADCKTRGLPEPYYVPDAEFQRWLTVTQPVIDEWVTTVAAKGLPAKAVFDDARSLIKKYSAK